MSVAWSWCTAVCATSGTEPQGKPRYLAPFEPDPNSKGRMQRTDNRCVTRLTPSHAEPYRALMLEAYALHPDAFTSSVTERRTLPLAWWQKRLAEDVSANEVVFGAFIGKELAGVAGLSFDTREKARHKSTLFGMYVSDRFRQQGLGQQLIHEVLAYALTRPGTKIVQLTVTAGNAPAQNLYTSNGFVPFGTEPFAVQVGAEYVSKVHMWCQLSLSSDQAAASSEL